ncbi:MAG: hypothetical protein ACKOCB_09665 [Planctomycetia bacterium]
MRAHAVPPASWSVATPRAMDQGWSAEGDDRGKPRLGGGSSLEADPMAKKKKAKRKTAKKKARAKKK